MVKNWIVDRSTARDFTVYSDLLLTLLPTRIINWCSKSYSRGTFFSHNKRTFVGGKGDRCFDWGFNSFKWLYQMIWVLLFIYIVLIKDVILFEIDCAIFYTNLHELFCQFISKLNKLGTFMDNCWVSCEVMADMKKKCYDHLMIINLYFEMTRLDYLYAPWCEDE